MTTEEFRLKTARDGLEGYEEWLKGREISPGAMSSLASAARWLVEMLDPAPVAAERCEW